MLSNTNKLTGNSLPPPITFCRSIDPSKTYPPPTTTERRASLTKAYSCSSASINVNYSFITVKQFFELTDQKSVPIVDCRSQIDYGCERIRSAYNINCRAKLMAKKLMSKSLEDIEPNLTNKLKNSDLVVLYDQSTDLRGAEEKIRSLPIHLVVQAARKSEKNVLIIQGGIDAVKTQYPHLIECVVEVPREKFEHDLLPPTPDAVDKENFTMTEIFPNVFVGNLSDAQNLERLTQHGITHVVNATSDLPFYHEKRCKYMRADALDLPSQNIRKYFDTVFQFIDEALRTKTNKVLVHCSAGISRSPTLVLAYMIKKQHITFDEAFQKMRQLRQIVDPNVSFVLQLREWEKKCLTPIYHETNDDHISSQPCPSSRASSATYCGSSSKTKTDSKKPVNVISVN